MIAYHLAAVEFQLAQIHSGWSIALALNRTFILPKVPFDMQTVRYANSSGFVFVHPVKSSLGMRCGQILQATAFGWSIAPNLIRACALPHVKQIDMRFSAVLFLQSYRQRS